MNDQEKRRLERKAKVGWKQYFRLKQSMIEILSVVNVVERPTLAPIIRRMILNQEENYRTCCICREQLTDEIAFLNKCGHTFDKRCYEAWLQHNRNCPECRGDSVYILV